MSSVVSFYIFLLKVYITKTLLSLFWKTGMDEELELESMWNFTWYFRYNSEAESAVWMLRAVA